MKKKFYLFIVLGIFTLAIIGVLLYWGLSEDKNRVTPGVKFEAPKYYVIKDGPDGKIVENKHAGITFKAPEGWNVEKKEIGSDEWIVNFTSPDATVSESGLLTGGCGISALIEYHEATFRSVVDRINDPDRYSKEISGNYEVINIDGHQALKRTLDRPEWGMAVMIQLPFQDKIFSFDTLFLPSEGQRCSSLIDEFLAEISII
ncbi:hypothetical protein KJ562_02555 [Patescibacteria group bacterium]|nr:hypothetical protein [Patescibacteria group bacterium]MBU4162350.1 hypothetical protein [Patescibacteria group bacterium]